MMNIDEAIAQAERIAEGQEKSAELSPCDHAKERISKSAAEHRQLAEWLTELKEAKRLLKEAVDIVHDYACGFCPCCKNYDKGRCLVDIYDCQHNDKWEWRYEAETLKLIGEDNDREV